MIFTNVYSGIYYDCLFNHSKNSTNRLVNGKNLKKVVIVDLSCDVLCG